LITSVSFICPACAPSAMPTSCDRDYTQSRLRQMIFGGTIRYILSDAELPGNASDRPEVVFGVRCQSFL